MSGCPLDVCDPLYKRHRFPVEVISHAVWLCFRFPLSLRHVEDLLAARSIEVSFQTVAEWARKFGGAYARRIRRASKGTFADNGTLMRWWSPSRERSIGYGAPWMDERLRFVARLLDGEGMSDVCRAFGISRKTGYKIWGRYREEGAYALCDRSRRPVRYANQLHEQVERLIVETEREKLHWGARKIREVLVKEARRIGAFLPRVPLSPSKGHAVLDQHGLVKRARQRRRCKAEGTELTSATAPNDLWCADFKGEFRLGNGRYCYSLTVSDQASRYLLACAALESIREGPVIESFVRLFKERGLPTAIRSDNGVPFASPNGLYNPSRLSVFWLRLGIDVERIRPGHPYQNGRHERMHLTLKKETTRPPGMNALQQQDRFDRFVGEFNEERLVRDVYCPSSKPSGLPFSAGTGAGASTAGMIEGDSGTGTGDIAQARSRAGEIKVARYAGGNAGDSNPALV